MEKETFFRPWYGLKEEQKAIAVAAAAAMAASVIVVEEPAQLIGRHTIVSDDANSSASNLSGNDTPSMSLSPSSSHHNYNSEAETLSIRSSSVGSSEDNHHPHDRRLVHSQLDNDFNLVENSELRGYYPASCALAFQPIAPIPVTASAIWPYKLPAPSHNYGQLLSSATGYHHCMQEAVDRLNHQDHVAKQIKKLRPKKFRCHYCHVAFSNNGQLKGHIRIHTGERPFKCEIENCGKSFTRNEELTRHKRIHTGMRPYACYVCHKGFGRKDHLKKHTKTHENRNVYRMAVAAATAPNVSPYVNFPLRHHYYHHVAGYSYAYM